MVVEDVEEGVGDEVGGELEADEGPEGFDDGDEESSEWEGRGRVSF